MARLFHSRPRLSNGLAISAALMLVAGIGVFGGTTGNAAAATANPHLGRWTVKEPNQRFSAKGREYQTIDIAPCGKDICGVSVSANGKCAAPLFRFLASHSGKDDDAVRGHGKWGTAKKKMFLYLYGTGEETARTEMQIYLGNSYDYDARSSSIPAFDAAYVKSGAARCTVR